MGLVLFLNGGHYLFGSISLVLGVVNLFYYFRLGYSRLIFGSDSAVL